MPQISLIIIPSTFKVTEISTIQWNNLNIGHQYPCVKNSWPINVVELDSVINFLIDFTMMEFWWIEEVLVDCLFDNGWNLARWGVTPEVLPISQGTYTKRGPLNNSEKVKPDEPATISAAPVAWNLLQAASTAIFTWFTNILYKSFLFIIATSSLYVWPKCMHR